MSSRPLSHPCARWSSALVVMALSAGSLLAAQAQPAAAVPNSDIGLPTFAGSKDPVPAEPVGHTDGSMMRSIFDADVKGGAGRDTGHDFWMDTMLARTGTAGDPLASNSDHNQYLFSRGRALFMKSHDPAVVGFGGDVAYIESINSSNAFAVSFSVDGSAAKLTEDTARRRQTPSYWESTFTDADHGLTVVETKYITDANVAVAGLKVSAAKAAKVTMKAVAPHATTTEGDELIGRVASFNKLTTLFPRFSGQGFTPKDGALVSTVSLGGGDSATTKLQEGFVTREVPASRTEYDHYRAASVGDAYTQHVTDYNRWWADNIPYIDLPDKNIEKTLYYRWWLMRFNFLDANVPGNDYQFPTAVEGALGYNNAIVLTSGMFIDDLKYLRDPSYAYGTWVSAGEVAKSGKATDNPGDPANWSQSYTEYISDAAWRSYEIHGGPKPVAQSLATYGENDVKGLLKDLDSNHNDLIEYDWASLTGNDADAVSFDWRDGANMDRAESAYVYANAKASAAAYREAGNTAKADELDALAAKVQKAVLDVLWNPDDKLIEHRIADGDHARVPWKEINNYYPFSVGLMPKPDGTAANDQYVQALRLWADADEYPVFPFFTANQKDKAAAAAAGDPGSNNFSVINSTVDFRLFSSVLHDYPNSAITPELYKKLLYWNAWAQYQGGDNRYPDQNEFWSDGSANPQKIGYRSWIHHTILGATNFTTIEDVAGLRPRADAKIELDPIDIGWDHFTVNNLRYRNSDLTIVWDKPGDGTRHYGDSPEGLSIFLDGKRAATVDSLTHVVFDPATGQVELPDGTGTVTSSAKADLAPANAVTFSDDDRVTDIFARAGKDISAADEVPADLAAGATATASFSADGRGPENAVNGTTINEPFWGTAGSPNASDSIDVDLGSAKTFDDLRLYFYRTSTSTTVPGYTSPAMYQLSYLDGSTWKTVPGQLRTPTVPGDNLNEVRFAPVTAQKVRVSVTHTPGSKTGLKEVELYSTGKKVTAPGNRAPVVDAYATAGATSVALTGTVKDDALPEGLLTQAWTVVSAPEGGTAVFAAPTQPSTTVQLAGKGTYVLRLSATDGDETTATDVKVDWDPPTAVNVAPEATPTAEFTAGWNKVTAVNDGTALNTGGDQASLWGSYSGDRPATRWLQYTWKNPVRVNGSDIAFWHDSPAGSGDGVAVPTSWKLQYLDADGTTWRDVANPSGYPVKDTGSNATTFDPVTTTALRATFTADSNGTTNAAMAVSEWQVLAEAPFSTTPVDLPTSPGTVPSLPATVEQVYGNGDRVQTPVSWPAITPEQVANGGSSFTVVGITANGGTVTATVWVRVSPAVTVNTVEPSTARTLVGKAPTLPATVTGVYNDGSEDSRLTVTWEPVPADAYAKPGTFTVKGAVEGTDKVATVTVTVVAADAGPDTTAPTVALALDPAEPDGTSGWYTGPVSVSATATDDTDPAPAVEVDVDGSGWAAAAEAVTLSTDGTHTVAVRATDTAGNTSKPVTSTVRIDATEPVSNARVDAVKRLVTLRGADATSGLDTIVYRVGDGDWQDYAAPFQVGKDRTVVAYAALDKAGNREQENSVTVAAVAAPVVASRTSASISGASVTIGRTFGATVKVHGGAGVASGTVVATAGDVELGRGALVGGKVRLRLASAALTAGRQTVRFAYSGDSRYAPSSDDDTVKAVRTASKTSVQLPAGKVVVGSTTLARVRVTAKNLSPSGVVTVKEKGKIVAAGVLADGEVAVGLPTVEVGKHRLSLSYRGDDRVEASSTKATLRVSKAPARVAASVTPAEVTPTTSAFVAVRVTSAQPSVVPGGDVRVTVRRGHAEVGGFTASLAADGSASVPLPALRPGGYVLEVRYRGSASVATASTTTTLTVTR